MTQTCSTCGGSGSTTCSSCSGLGHTECRCSNCSGSGYIRRSCANCGGSGFNRSAPFGTHPCGYCRGGQTEERCAYCTGGTVRSSCSCSNGRRACSRCSGSGSTFDITNTWPNSDATNPSAQAPNTTSLPRATRPLTDDYSSSLSNVHGGCIIFAVIGGLIYVYVGIWADLFWAGLIGSVFSVIVGIVIHCKYFDR